MAAHSSKNLSRAFLGSRVGIKSYLITRARVRTFPSHHLFPSFTCPIPLGLKTPCYKIPCSTLRNAQIGSKELQEMVGESVTLTAGSAGAHPAASRVADWPTWASRRLWRPCNPQAKKLSHRPRAEVARGRGRKGASVVFGKVRSGAVCRTAGLGLAAIDSHALVTRGNQTINSDCQIARSFSRACSTR